jgi:cyclopropane-fatty-acyl-phospholipid synthase
MTLLERVASSPLNYRATLIADPIAAMGIGVYGVIAYNGLFTPALVAVIAGFLTWSFLEYVLHRWVLHGVFAGPRREHAKHHGSPKATISTPLLVIPIFAMAIYVSLSFVLSSGIAALYTFGIYVGYNYFAIIHHLLHHRPNALTRMRWFEDQARFHDEHHDHPRTRFGISSNFWDRLFRTSPEDDQIVMKQAR